MVYPSQMRRSPYGDTGKRGAILSPHRFCVPCWSRLGVARRAAVNMFGVSHHTLKTYGFGAIDSTARSQRAHQGKAAKKQLQGFSIKRVLQEQADAFERETRLVVVSENISFKHPEAQRWVGRQNARKVWTRKSSDASFRLKKNMRRRAWKFARGLIRGSRTSGVIGCTQQQFRNWIERHLKPGMTWENYGEWEIDHVRPCASFDLSDPKQVSECFHFTNTQPMWRTENRIKSSVWAGLWHGLGNGERRVYGSA